MLKFATAVALIGCEVFASPPVSASKALSVDIAETASPSDVDDMLPHRSPAVEEFMAKVKASVNANASSLTSGWPWGDESQESGCTGNAGPPPGDGPWCYTGEKYGETMSVRVLKYDRTTGAGTIQGRGSGLSDIKCDTSFSKSDAQQQISVAGLAECLPSEVAPSVMKYCSDQNTILLQATIDGWYSAEIVLASAPDCAKEPASLVTDGELASDDELARGLAGEAPMVRREIRRASVLPSGEIDGRS